jgi:nitrogen PTS system EIIA component
MDFQAIDGAPVHHFFLIVAPPLEVSNQYLPVLGQDRPVRQGSRHPAELSNIDTPEGFLRLLEERAP